MGPQLVTKALDQAVSARRRADTRFTGQGVIVHSDAGSQLTGLAFSQKLLDHGLAGSIGRVGTAHDNTLIESTIGLYKSELIRSGRRAWVSRQEIETATTAWVTWFNEHRLHSKLGYPSPVKYEAAYNQPGPVEAGRVREDPLRSPARFTAAYEPPNALLALATALLTPFCGEALSNASWHIPNNDKLPLTA